MARRSRAAETRDATARPDPQSNFQSTLYFPEHLWPKGTECHWVRAAAGGQADPGRWANANLQDGWKPMTLDEAPQFAIPGVDGTVPTGGIIRIGDLILCKRPKALGDKLRQSNEKKAQDQMVYLDDYVSDNPDAGVINRFSYSGPAEIRASRSGVFKD